MFINDPKRYVHEVLQYVPVCGSVVECKDEMNSSRLCKHCTSLTSNQSSAVGGVESEWFRGYGAIIAGACLFVCMIDCVAVPLIIGRRFPEAFTLLKCMISKLSICTVKIRSSTFTP